MNPVFLLFVMLPAAAFAQGADAAEFFEKKIRPVFATSCQACHNSKIKTAGLDMSSVEGFLHGGQSGPLIDKTNPAESRLLLVVSYDERLKMPPTGKLPASQLADLETWVKMGAPWPGAAAAPAAGPAVRKQGRELTDQERRYWAFQPVAKPALPQVNNQAWVARDLDRFILSKLEAKSIEPAKPAPKLTLLRRATFDLTGLPPTEKEIADFEADNSPGAFARVVDRLLSSPRYGERWGRHWLDVARFADSTGNDEDHRYPHAWRYRDYVIESFNNDVPFDQFAREQIAGDLMPAPSGGINRRGIVATGFLALGAKAIAQQDKKKMVYDVYDEQLDTVSKGFLGVTLSCARCHDHKFDPFFTRDYYSIINFFANTKSFEDSKSHVSRLLSTPLVPAPEYKAYRDHLDRMNAVKLEQEDLVETAKQKRSETLTPKLAFYMLAAHRVIAGSADPAHAAAKDQLDPQLVAKWAQYLRTSPKAKPHLESWAAAAPATIEQAAARYQKGYADQLAKWNVKINEWREQVRRMLKEMNMPPPPRPQFKAEEDGFFYDVYIDSNGPFAVNPKEQDSILPTEVKEAVARLKQQHDELKAKTPPEPDMACAVSDGEDPVAQKVFVRGDYASLGEDAPKAFPRVLSRTGDPVPSDSGSGRLALANWIGRKENPLTARVIVNRVWHWHFGEGIVRTPDNFGATGQRPTHPELLDYLAAKFVEDGWSFKKLHREIMLSNTYRMASEPSPKAVEADPDNKLWSRFQRRRLQVEEIRDGLLAMDGSIDFTMGGTLQSGVGTDGENSQDRLSISPEKQVRRTVYLPLRRANLPTLLNLFDFGDATTPQGRRIVTNVAPQALFMMNSEFLTERSAKLAGQLLGSQRTQAQRLEAAYLRTLNRKPAAEEIDSGLSYLSSFQKRFAGADSEKHAWQSICRVLMASNDFIYVD